MSTVWIFLNTATIGGAERRFAGLWESLRETGKCNLVLPESLFIMLRNSGDIRQVGSENPNVYFLEGINGSFLNLRKIYKKFIDEHVGKKDVLHFIGGHPLFFTPGRKQVFSITANSMKIFNKIGQLNHLAGVWMSDVTDVLDPTLFLKLKKYFKFKQKSIFRTSNSYCDIERFQPIPYSDKKDWIVFAGRFERVKQVVELVKAIPAIYEAVKQLATKDLHFYLLGNGSQEEHIRDIAKGKEFSGIPLTIEFCKNPEGILRSSKIFLSLQLYNNYPSRSLIEAMASGNIPLVTDTGQTRWLAKPAFSYYVAEEFSSTELASAIAAIFKEEEAVLAEKALLVRKCIQEEHSIARMREYYEDLYSNAVGAESTDHNYRADIGQIRQQYKEQVMIPIINPANGEPMNPVEGGYRDLSGSFFPLRDGALRIVQESNYTDSFGFQWNKFERTQIDRAHINTEQSKQRLFAVTNWEKEDLTGQNILEVGSGAGRFSQIVLDHTRATLYSVDFSDAVSANYRNNSHHGDRLKLFQASIYELPFPDNVFDKVFCFGVLQHTPDFKKSVECLIRKVKPGGELLVDFYPIKGVWTKLNAKYILRPITKKMSHEKLLAIIEKRANTLISAYNFFDAIKLGKIVNRFLPVCDIKGTLPHDLTKEELREWVILDTFDMFSPQHDHPQKVSTVAKWFREFNMDVTFEGIIRYGDNFTVAAVKGIKK